jgi:hypothetical protein
MSSISVKDEIARINALLAGPAHALALTSRGPSSTISESSSQSSVSKCERARKSDIYSLVDPGEIQRIITDIAQGRLASNTPSVKWSVGQKHNPNSPDTIRIRNLLFVGPKTKEELAFLAPTISKKTLTGILHELREQGIVNIERASKKGKN